MKKNKSFELICDIEGMISDIPTNQQAYLELETAYHETQESPFLSVFTRRDKGPGETEGTEVWLSVESARMLADEILEWCDEQDGEDYWYDDDDDDAFVIPDDDEDDYDKEFNRKGFYYGKPEGLSNCPHCGGTDLGAYSQDQWETPIVWCESCMNMIENND